MISLYVKKGKILTLSKNGDTDFEEVNRQLPLAFIIHVTDWHEGLYELFALVSKNNE